MIKIHRSSFSEVNVETWAMTPREAKRASRILDKWIIQCSQQQERPEIDSKLCCLIITTNAGTRVFSVAAPTVYGTNKLSALTM